ncbi:MAG: hypothetical protein MUE76_01315, partial [Syntrophales bacterium]|nr:hypothetical protein [Syntrophales bacterium]
ICPEQEAFASFVQDTDFVIFSLVSFFREALQARSICFSLSSPHGLPKTMSRNISNLKTRRARAQRLL